MKKKAVLLINFGSPQEPTQVSVSQYLKDVFSDHEMLPFPRLVQQIIVPTILVPYQKRKLAERYKKIWSFEGSPFLLACEDIRKKLENRLPADWLVFCAMRYGTPNFHDEIRKIINAGVSSISVIPLFPQWTDVVTGSFLRAIFSELSKTECFEKIHFVTQFHTHTDFITALTDGAKALPIASYDHILFVYHGLPIRLARTSCSRYADDCEETAELCADKLNAKHSKYSVAFSSKFGPGTWLRPDAFDVVANLAKCGIKNTLVFCPSHIVPSLETSYEVGVELKNHFQKHGGQTLDLAEPPYLSPAFTTLLEKLVTS
jgi:ferrochelatase